MFGSITALPSASTSVRQTTDKHEIHAFLQGDPVYGAYAIGDLEDAHFQGCIWFLANDVSGQPRALVLLYRFLDPPVLLTMGQAAALAAIMDQAPLPAAIYASTAVDHLPVLLAHYDFSQDRVRPMFRMVVTPDEFIPVQRKAGSVGVLRRLSIRDLAALDRLYACGGHFGPDAFSPAQLMDGIFFGLEAGGQLLAVAGTHLVAPNWGVAAVGNIFTHPAHRGLGHGLAVTSAVTAELLDRGLLVVLNVATDNVAAIRMYRQLGYRVHCPYYEGGGRLIDDNRIPV